MKKLYVILSIMLLGIGNQLYAAKAYEANGTNTVSIFDTTTNMVTGIVNDPNSTFNDIQQIAITPDGTTAYVVNGETGSTPDTGSVSVINVANDTVTGIVTDLISPTFNSPFGIAITPDGTTAYVANTDGATISIIDTTRNVVTGTITGFNNPQSIAITPDGTTAYVTDNGNNNDVRVVDLASKTVIQAISSANFNEPFLIAITPNGLFAYEVNSGNNIISIINLKTNTVIGSVIDPHSTINNPGFIAITPDGTTAYVTNYSDNSVSVIDLVDNIVTQTITNPNFNGPMGIAFTQDGTTAYVADYLINSVSIINVANNTVSAMGFVTDLDPQTILIPNFIAIVPIVVPPSSSTPVVITGVQTKNIFLTQTDYINVISWTVPTDITPVSYNVYRDAALTNLVGSVTVTPTTPLQLSDHNRNPNLSYTYYVVAVDGAGITTLLGNATVLGSYNSTITF